MPETTELELIRLRRVAHDAAAFAASIQWDLTGDAIGHQFIGNGNGGMISPESQINKDALQRSLIDLNAKEA